MRVGVDATALVDLHSGAARRILELWSRTLTLSRDNSDRLQFELTLLTRPSLREELAERMPHAKVIALDPAKNPVDRWLHYNSSLRRVIKAESIDYLFQDPRPLACPQITLPTIHDLRSLDPRFSSFWRRSYAKFWSGRELRRCPHILTVSRYVAQELQRRYRISSTRITVIHNGVDRQAFAVPCTLPPKLTARLSGRPFLLTVGHREARKNLPFAIDVLARLKSAGFQHQLVIAGRNISGYDEPEKRVAELGLANDVVFLADVPEESLIALYQAATAFLFPSLLEGFGIPLLEAMAASCPVLVADHPPFDELVPEASRLPLVAEDWGQYLQKMIEDSAIRVRELEVNRRQAAIYGWEGPASSLLDLLEDLTAESTKG